MKFRGESTNKVDAKGRVSVPASFRRVLEAGDPDWTEGQAPKFTIIYGGKTQKHLEVYTQTAMADVDARIALLPRGSHQRRALERIFTGQALQATTDDAGRLILPLNLREKIGITDQAYFTAALDTFQIWNPDAFEDKDSDLDEWIEAQGEDFDPLMLLELAPKPAETGH